MLLSEFDILYVSQKAIEWSAIANFLVEKANEEYEPMSFDFPDEDLMVLLQIEKEKSPEENGWKIYFNGASNALKRGVGAILISHEEITAHLQPSWVLIVPTMWQNTRHVR